MFEMSVNGRRFSTATLILAGLLCSCILSFSCSKKESEPKTSSGSPPASRPGSTDSPTMTPPPQSDFHYVLDKRSNIIFEIDLRNNTISRRFLRDEPIVAIDHDSQTDWLFEAVGKPESGLNVFDTRSGDYIQKYRFPDPPSDILFHPLQRAVYIVSEDSTHFRVFSPDSMKFVLGFPLHIQNQAFVGPTTIQPGPAGKLITANGKRASVTQIFTENNFMYQTVINHLANVVHSAVFSFDGKASYSCDSEQGAVFKIEFGSGRVLAEKYQLQRPRDIQLEVNSNTVCVVVGSTQVLMFHPETLTEMGRVDLGQYGDEILSLHIPPKANFAEMLLDYKGVTRWMRVDILNWQPTRFLELI